MIAFDPNGPLLSFTAAAGAPASVQATSLDNVPNYEICLTNADTTNDAVIGWGQSDAQAKTAAAGAGPNCFYLLHNSQAVVVVPANSFVTGIAVASTAVIKVQAGISIK